jgi:hypothetical protein
MRHQGFAGSAIAIEAEAKEMQALEKGVLVKVECTVRPVLVDDRTG